MKTYFKIDATSTYEENIRAALLVGNSLGLNGNKILQLDCVKGENKTVYAIDLTVADDSDLRSAVENFLCDYNLSKVKLPDGMIEPLQKLVEE